MQGILTWQSPNLVYCPFLREYRSHGLVSLPPLRVIYQQTKLLPSEIYGISPDKYSHTSNSIVLELICVVLFLCPLVFLGFPNTILKSKIAVQDFT